MQLTQNKRRRSFLIEFFCRFFAIYSIRNSIRKMNRSLPLAPFRIPSAWSFSSHSSLATSHCFSNRQTPPELEMPVTRTKQTLGPVSNRQRYAFFATDSQAPAYQNGGRCLCFASSPLVTHHPPALMQLAQNKTSRSSSNRVFSCIFLARSFPNTLACHSSLVTRHCLYAL
jgi:hypothetical protein